MVPLRRISALVILLLSSGLYACSSSKSVFPASGSVALDLLDSGLKKQTASSASSQVVRWTLEGASAEIEGFGSYEFLGVTPCTYTHNVLARQTLQNACGGSSLVLGADVARSVTVQLVISAMEVRRAFRPDLSSSGDYDGDGVANGTDNCPLVPNPDQALYQGSAIGAACAFHDSDLAATYRDSDADGIEDEFDDCVWVANPNQADSNSDGIGNACEQVARVVFPTGACPAPGPYAGTAYACVSLSALSLTPSSGSLKTLTVDFDDRQTLVECDPSFTRCFLNKDAVTIAVK